MSLPSWSQYQEDAADFFRRLGLSAETNESLTGVRSTHDVDVVVRFERAGIPHLWVVECKDYSRAVEKEKPLVLRTIVDDVGADRGFLLCEKDFQRGAREVVEKTNILVTSLAELEAAGSDELFRVELANLEFRLRAAEHTWRELRPPVRREAGGGLSIKLPVLPGGSWPSHGAVELTGRMSEIHTAIEHARFNEFPVHLSEPNSDGPQRVTRAELFPAVSRALSRIEETVAFAKRPAR